MEAVTKLIAYVIPIVVLILIVVFFFGGEGGFTKVKSAFNKTKSYLPDITLGAEKLQAEKPSIPQEQEEALRLMVKTMHTMLKASAPCLSIFPAVEGTTVKSLPPLQGTVIKLFPEGISIATGKGQVVTDLARELSAALAGFIPCVVIEEPSPGAREVMYIKVPEISISFQKGLFGGGNVFRYETGGEMVEERLPRFLYNPTGRSSCFVAQKVDTLPAGECK